MKEPRNIALKFITENLNLVWFLLCHDTALSELTAVLQPVEEAVIKLSKHNSNLMIAEAVAKFVHQTLSSQRSKFAEDLDNLVM